MNDMLAPGLEPMDDPAGLPDTPLPALSAPPRSFAGLPIATLVLGGLLLVIALWAAWATRELLELRSHRIVSVSLTGLVRDFVAAEARAGGSPEQATAKVRVYLDATASAVKSLEDQGYTVLVSEAVLGHAVPDVTRELKAAVDAKVRDLVTAPGAAMPPASLPLAPSAMSPPAPAFERAASPVAAAPASGGEDGQ